MTPTSTIADLYLAFRQAKTTLFFEKRGAGLIALSKYENKLPEHLRNLEIKIANGKWFDEIEDIGDVWIVPKKLRPRDDEDDDVVRIGTSPKSKQGQAIDIQTRLSPHPDFAIVEVLYLWRFGGLLEKLLSKQDVLGYRLDLKNQEVQPHRRWLFEYWPTKYNNFRYTPLKTAKRALANGTPTTIISADLASFYDTIDPSFMLSDSHLAELKKHGASTKDITEYKRATESLLGIYSRYQKRASRCTTIPHKIGVPIGSITSRIVANLSLAPLDHHIATQPGILCYRRYVDDLVIVATTNDNRQGFFDTIQQYIPTVPDNNGTMHLDVNLLKRSGSEFQLQKSKTQVQHLAGIPGIDFIEAIESDFSRAVSERRDFVDSSTLMGDGVQHLIQAGDAQRSPIRVLRDADRTRLERFSLSTSLASLERISSLINHEEAQRLVRNSLERVARVLDFENDWVADLDLSLRLLKLAIGTGDWKSTNELLERMDRVWKSTRTLQSATTRLYYRECEIVPEKKTPWVWLRNYLHERRLEAICTVLPIGMDAKQVAHAFAEGVTVRTQQIQARRLQSFAEDLASSDLRARDREDDYAEIRHQREIDRNWMRKEVNANAALSERLTYIDAFVERCNELGDNPWLMPPARLFLCTRPPSYFDIARRWLYLVEQSGFGKDVFNDLLNVVNAVRGNNYRDPVGEVVGDIDDTDPDNDNNTYSTVRIDPFWHETHGSDPRIILANLNVEIDEWKGAATRVVGSPFGAPLQTKKRLEGVNEILKKSTQIAREHYSLLVFPELSIPRRWFRTIANHVARHSQLGVVLGLEYRHYASESFVLNQAFAVLPGPFMSVAAWPWTKRIPAHEEGRSLASLPTPVSFPPTPKREIQRTVVQSKWGDFSVLICSELFEARRVADLFGRVELVLCPSWNTDTATYDHLIQSVGFKLHSIIAIANNGKYSDCRAWAPLTERWQRDLCRLVERDVNDIVHVELPLKSLRKFRRGDSQISDSFSFIDKALEQQKIGEARKALKELMTQSPGKWRPLPPGWT